MRRALVGIVGALSLAGCGEDEAVEARGPEPARADLFAAVDPRIGTAGVGFGVGSAYPGPAVPFAMIHPSPDTRTSVGAVSFYHCSGYYAQDEYLRAVSLVHFEGTGVPDYGAIGILPTLGMSDAKREEGGRMVKIDKASEQMRPGYYAVRLEDGIGLELTSSRRAATLRFDFPEHGQPVLMFPLDHRLEGTITKADYAFSGSDFDLHVHHDGNMSGGPGGYDLFARGALDVTPKSVGGWDGSALHPGQAQGSGVPLGAWVEFPAGTRTVTVRLAVSFVDGAGAKKNLDAEAPGFDFAGMRAAAEEEWKKELGQLEIYGANAYDTTLMATAAYHAHLMPTLMSDVDGRYVDVFGKVASGSRERFNDFSLWDTYRTLHPWLLLAEDAHNADFVASLVSMAAQGGAVPVWGIAHGDCHTMIGSPGEIVLAECAQKGVPFDDEKAAYQLARVAAYEKSPGPVGGRDDDLPVYLAKGYVPSDVSSGSVSKTQEYAVADAALARWAARLGIGADATELGARGKNYQHHFDESVGFFRAKKSDGTWAPFHLPTNMDDAYVEGNAWHYLWMVPHDPEGLAETLGGTEAALARLREFFELSHDEKPILGVRQHYWPSNEPDLSAPWFFAAWGSPGETFQWVDWIVTTLYTAGTDGIPGNDDGGTMSAWLLFAGAGLYPIPGSDRYIVSAPRYPKLVLHRPSGDLVIEAKPAPAPGLVPKRVLLDDVELTTSTITHGELAGTHRLSFVMGKAE